jgi:hypothetical protein
VGSAIVALTAASQTAAQIGQQPNLVLTIFAGAGAGHDLWVVGKQPLQFIGTSQYDTLRLSQAIAPSIIAGIAATYFRDAHLGFHVELSYVGFPVDGGCTGLFFHPDFEEKNAQTCADIQGSGSEGGAIAFFTGVTLRATARRAISPYVRLNVGLIGSSRSTIAMSGEYVTARGVGFREVITDPRSRHAALTFGASAGFTRPISPGYQFRWEVRDLVLAMNRVTRAANGVGIPPTASRLYHHFSLILGLDVVLEKKRGRRY